MGQNTAYDVVPVPADSAPAAEAGYRETASRSGGGESGGASDWFFPDISHQALVAKVVMPPNASTVHIAVMPGEVVELPFGADAHFEAAIGHGNLAIKVGELVVILEGYVAAGRTPPMVETADGHPLDIAAILAETDPATDIQTAAGAGSQTGGQGADNTGAILQPFDGDESGLGGFLGAGAQGDSHAPDGLPPVDVSRVTELLLQSTVPGKPNVPPVAPDFTFTTDEDHGLTGQLAATDADGNTLNYALVGAAPTGLSLESNGKWIFDPAGHYDDLTPGDTAAVSYQYDAVDGGGHSTMTTVTIGVTGVNDVPQLAGGTPGILTTEDATGTTVALGLQITDPDNATHTISLVGPVPDGFGYDAKTDQILIDPAGHYDALKEGEKGDVTLHFQVSDGTATVDYNVDVEIIGVDDAPKVIGDLTGEVTEDSGVTVTGQIFIVDPDSSGLEFPDTHYRGNWGIFTLSPDGKWTYALDDLDPFVDKFTDKKTLTDTFLVDDKDITITVHGHNDAPKLESFVTPLRCSENDGEFTFSLDLGSTISDPDSTDFTYSLVGAVPAGLTLDADRTVHFSPAGHYDYLSAGEHAAFVVSYKVTDDSGADSNIATFQVYVDGVNDAARAVADSVYLPGDIASISPTKAGDFSVQDDANLGGFFNHTVTDGIAGSGPGRVTILNHDGGALTGSAGHEILIGGSAGDKIDGRGGNDRIFGGDGDDTVIFHDGDVVQGGGNTGPHALTVSRGDVLAIDHDINFPTAALTQSGGIETLSLKEAGAGEGSAQTLTIGAPDVAQLSDHTLTPNAVFGEHDAIHIDLEAVDQLYLSIRNDGGAWVHYETGDAYEAYAHQAAVGDDHTIDAYVLVQTPNAANVHMNQDAP
jgi:VCBS repeat-containing protein